MVQQVHDDAVQRPLRALVLAFDDLEDAGQALDVRVRMGLGINPIDFAVLRWVERVHRRGGSTRVGDVTDHFGVSSGSATEIVHRLTRAGLLERQQHPTDARVRNLVPTPHARKRLEEFVGDVRTELDALLGTVTDEEEQRIVELLSAMCEIFSAVRGTDRD